MECKFNKKEILQILVYLIGVGLFVWQSYSTFKTFSSFRTTVASSKESYGSLPPPTIVICQRNNQFWLNDEMNLSIILDNTNSSIDGKTLNLHVGTNVYEEENENWIFVGDFNNPWIGLCYGIILSPNITMNIRSSY